MGTKVSLRDKSIAFIGFMGVGKTTIGKLVAKKLGRKFIDIDAEIEKEFKMPVSEIFKKYGEDVFRKRERELVMSTCKKKNNVVSLGGGSFLQKEIRNVCMGHCIVYHLDMNWDDWKERIDLIFDTRPVLHGKSLEEIKELFYERKKIYADHHYRILLNDLNSEAASEQIIDTIKTAWEQQERL